MSQQLSVAVSDSILALSAGRAAMKSKSLLAFGGFGLMGVAAALGALRFAGVDHVVPYHTFMADTATQVGVPMIGLAFYLFAGRVSPGQLKMHKKSVMLIAALCGLSFFVRNYLLYPQQEIYNLVISLISLGLIVRIGLKLRVQEATFGALLFAAAGLVGTFGEIGGIKRVDIFHVGLAGACYLLSEALRRTTL